MSVSGTDVRDAAARRRVRNGALCLGFLALALYLGFIALLVFRSRH
jgi:hypothetical protein